MTQKKKKTLDEIQWIEMELKGEEDKGKQLVCSISDAAVYLDLGETATIQTLTENDIKRWKPGFGNKKYVKKADLDELWRGRPAE
jgi:hypothetical protein